jgi:tetratricopeptide (TPR) repeat protein
MGASWADLAERQDYIKALADFDQALNLNPRLASAWGNRGLALLIMGRTGEAEQSLARCRDLDGRLNAAAES